MNTLGLIRICLFELIFGSLVLPQPQKTTVTPFLDVSHRTEQNIVYASSFGLAWKMLQNEILHENVKTEPVLQIIECLNNSAPAVIDEASSVCLAGFTGEGIVDKIGNQLLRKFNRKIDLTLYEDLRSNIICYSYFRKKIRFKTPFENFNSSFPFFYSAKAANVEYFGIWNVSVSQYHEELRKQIKICDHRSNDDFILRLNNPDEDDEVIIAEIQPASTFEKTIASVIERIKKFEPEIPGNNDRFLIPKIKFEYIHRYTDLYGKHLSNEGFEQYFFTEALQEIDFELTETGAIADSEAKLVLKKGPEPRIMVIDHPFLVMMKNKNCDKPYFAAWIENPVFLRRVN